jgi:hypothetical protein
MILVHWLVIVARILRKGVHDAVEIMQILQAKVLLYKLHSGCQAVLGELSHFNLL